MKLGNSCKFNQLCGQNCVCGGGVGFVVRRERGRDDDGVFSLEAIRVTCIINYTNLLNGVRDWEIKRQL